jgi:hypothetical protein
MPWNGDVAKSKQERRKGRKGRRSRWTTGVQEECFLLFLPFLLSCLLLAAWPFSESVQFMHAIIFSVIADPAEVS